MSITRISEDACGNDDGLRFFGTGKQSKKKCGECQESPRCGSAHDINGGFDKEKYAIFLKRLDFRCKLPDISGHSKLDVL
jgi:hypothetical protein